MITQIKNLEFQNFAFTILRNDAIANIFKIMIFIDLINNSIKMTKYLHSKLSKYIKIKS